MRSRLAKARAYLDAIERGELARRFFAVFLEFDGDKIRRQRNYDCFDPF